MDGPTVGLVGGIAGGVIGTCGGLVGTYFSLKSAKGLRERALMWRLAVLMWLAIVAVLALMFWLPPVWRWSGQLFMLPILLSIPYGNRRLAEARARDEGRAPVGTTAPSR